MADKILNILDDVQKGISPSYVGKFNKLTNVDIDSVPGAVLQQYALQKDEPNATTTYDAFVVTADASTDEIISATQPLKTIYSFGQAVRFTTTGTLPAGLSVNTTYYKSNAGSTDFRIKVASSFKNLEDGTYVDITDAGTGTHTMTAVKITALLQIIPLLTGSSLYQAAAVDSNGNVLIQRSPGTAWMKLDGHGTGAIYGLAYWKNYLFIFHYSNVDVYGPINGLWSTGSWDNAKFSFVDSATYHPSVIMSNDILYIGSNNDVASLMENTGKVFDPDDVSTYTFNSSALDLPADEDIYSLDQLGSNLMIGTGGTGIGKIYSWDTISPSFNEPIQTNLSIVSTTISIDGVLYFIDNYWGTIYATNGSTTKKMADFPKSSAGIQQVYQTNPLTISSYGTSIIRFRDKILFGVGGGYMPGIYSYNINTGAIVLEYTGASGYTGPSSVLFYALYSPSAIQLYASVWDNSITGSDYKYQIQTIDTSGTGLAYKASTTEIETGFLQIGTKLQPRTFQFFEIVLGKEIPTGCTITLYYRLNATDSYTTIGTFSPTDGAIHSKVIDNSTVTADQIQFKATITCAASTVTTGVELKAIYVY